MIFVFVLRARGKLWAAMGDASAWGTPSRCSQCTRRWLGLARWTAPFRSQVTPSFSQLHVCSDRAWLHSVLWRWKSPCGDRSALLRCVRVHRAPCAPLMRQGNAGSHSRRRHGTAPSDRFPRGCQTQKEAEYHQEETLYWREALSLAGSAEITLRQLSPLGLFQKRVLCLVRPAMYCARPPDD